MNTIAIDSNIYRGAEMYAKMHNISLRQMVEGYLAKFQESVAPETVSEVECEELSEQDDFLKELSPSLMKGLAEFAVREHRNGHCLTQEQVESSIMEEMGWN